MISPSGDWEGNGLILLEAVVRVHQFTEVFLLFIGSVFGGGGFK